MTFWPLTNSDFPTNQTFYHFHDLNTDFDRHRIKSGFHGAFATGNALPSRHLVPSPIVGLACAPIVGTRFLELVMSLLEFSSRIPLGTFSILPFSSFITINILITCSPSSFLTLIYHLIYMQTLQIFFFCLLHSSILLFTYMTGLVQTSSEATGSWSLSPLIVSRDSFSHQTWARFQPGGAQPALFGCR